MDTVRLSAIGIKHLASLALVGIPLLWLVFCVDVFWFESLTRSNLGLPIQWHTVEAWQWYLAIAVTALPTIAFLWGLAALRRAFSAFVVGQYFTSDNIINLRRFACALMISGLLRLLVFAALSVILSLNHDSGEKMLSFRVGSQDVAVIAIALIFWVTAASFAKGLAIEKENKQFI